MVRGHRPRLQFCDRRPLMAGLSEGGGCWSEVTDLGYNFAIAVGLWLASLSAAVDGPRSQTSATILRSPSAYGWPL